MEIAASKVSVEDLGVVLVVGAGTLETPLALTESGVALGSLSQEMA